ncbi:MAG: FlgD immunoglobulin-like domain containing protein [Chitinophagales bacterium]
MRKKAHLFILAIAMFSMTQAHAINLCFNDWFGFVYNVNATKTAPGYWTIAGTVDIGGGTIWTLSGYLDRNTPSMQVTATNPAPDGCTFYSDGFTFTMTSLGGGFIHGTWESFCFGGVIGTGTVELSWSYGACPFRMDNTGTIGAPALVNPDARANTMQLIGNEVSIFDALESNTLDVVSSGNNFQINYSLVEADQNVNIDIYNHVGQYITTIVQGKAAEGTYSISWNGTNTNGEETAPGMYLQC